VSDDYIKLNQAINKELNKRPKINNGIFYIILEAIEKSVRNWYKTLNKENHFLIEMENIVVLLTVIHYGIDTFWESNDYITYANYVFIELTKIETPKAMLSYFKSNLSLIKLGE
jgi:hypothetical protein